MFQKRSRSLRSGLWLLAVSCVLCAFVSSFALAQRTAKAGEATMKKNQKKAMKDKKGNKMMKLPSRIVLVFPTDAKDRISRQLSDVITDLAREKMVESGNYQTVYFLGSLPTVRRALLEGADGDEGRTKLAPTDVDAPFDDDAKLKRLIPVTGYDMALVSAIDSYSYDDKKNQVSMLLSMRLIDFSGAKPVIIQAYTENATSPEGSANSKEIDLAVKLAKQLGERAAAAMLKPKAATTPGQNN